MWKNARFVFQALSDDTLQEAVAGTIRTAEHYFVSGTIISGKRHTSHVSNLG